MRIVHNLNDNWQFCKQGQACPVNLPHTWNNVDGQDGGNDYFRGTCTYQKEFPLPDFDPRTQCVYLEFLGVNASARVELNGKAVCTHDGGYSTFREEITDLLRGENTLVVRVDNSVNDRVYPQKADFTFYGGIYRDVNLVVLSKSHFDMDYFGGSGVQITATPVQDRGEVQVKTRHNAPEAAIRVRILDQEGNTVAEDMGQPGQMELSLTIPGVHLWDGVRDPWLYQAEVTLILDGQPMDRVDTAFGVRSFSVDPEKGFILNGRPFPLRGVSRHQDYKGIGNALTPKHHERDFELICEMGANTVRLAHYQHDPYVYDLCDRLGLVVWAEIPYISEHLPNGRENTIQQMQELIIQNYNHPCIVCWGVSNEITISTRDKADMLDNHRVLNDLCHRMDPTRFTTLACYAMCSPFNRVAHITDTVSWNLYLGWYVPGLFLNQLWIDFFHWKYPKRPLGFSEYGCEAMPNLHSAKPRRGDHSEEYQAIYHQHMLRCFDKRPFLWATHVWNMFDFAADARDQGGEPGMNHKGLVTFDRQTKKDSFYLYKAWWSDRPFVHICGKRRKNRAEAVTEVKVYSNQPEVTLYAEGKPLHTKTGDKVFTFRVPLSSITRLEAMAGDCTDQAVFCKTEKDDPAYRLKKGEGKGQNWV